jgi:amino acid adenylation domain-containing protein
MHALHGLANTLAAYPLSPLQHGMLVDHLAGGHRAGVDVQQLDLSLRGSLDQLRLIRAWEIVAAHHPALRTRVRWQALEAPQQEVLNAVSVPVTEQDLSSRSAASQTAAVDKFLENDRVRGFDLSRAPLWRVAVFSLGDERHRLIWTYAHVVLDDCARQVLREVFEVYGALGAGAVPPLESRPRYGDYIAWLQQDWPARAQAARAFWREQLRGVMKPTTFDGLQPTAAGPESIAGCPTLRVRISASARAALERLCESDHLQLSSCIHAAWAMVLGAFTGLDDCLFGELRSCRHSAPGAQQMVGQVMNTVPLRAQLRADRTVRELLRELDGLRAAVRPFEHTPLTEAAAAAAVPGGARLFDSVVFGDDLEETPIETPGLIAERVILHERSAFAFTVRANLSRDEIALTFDPSRVRTERARSIATLTRRLLHAMAARPDSRIGELPRLPAADQRLLARFNRTSVEVEAGCVHHAVEAQVDRTPDAVAIVCRGRSLTYRELDERANRVAAELVANGIGPDRPVGVWVDRSLDLVVGLLGILKAGGAYVPLDPSYPAERIRMMLEDTRPGVIVTTDRWRASLPPSSARAVSVDALRDETRTERVRSTVSPDQLAYVIFTSGSSGRPKGVQVEHRNIVNCFCGIDRVLGTAPGVWLALTGISFDISVIELFWTLSRGFTVVVQDVTELPEGGSAVAPGAVRTLLDFDLRLQIRQYGVTHLQCTPSLLERFVLQDGGVEALGTLRHLLVGGEAFPTMLVEQLGPHLSGTLHNMYGPTETTIWSTSAVVTAGRPVTIGRPLANTTVHIRDHTLGPVPIGVPGELLIGGAGVARGYIGRADLTAERFVEDAVTGERLYRTGDLAAWRTDGELVFLGRIDHQVKIRGHRVELEEIDRVLTDHPSVRDCVTVAQHAASGDVRVIAYVVPATSAKLPNTTSSAGKDSAAVSTSDENLAWSLRQFARTRLPAFMVPAAVVLLDTMPLTPNGKIDRGTLVARSAARQPAAVPLPDGHRAQTIMAVLRELVGHEVGVDENFFAAGAHSLLLLQASTRLATRLGRSVTLEQIFQHPTARALASALADADAASISRDRAQQRQTALRRRAVRGPR